MPGPTANGPIRIVWPVSSIYLKLSTAMQESSEGGTTRAPVSY